MLNYLDTIKFLYSLQSFGIKLGLENIEKLLATLSFPHTKYRTVHIAGTNGKGSTAAALEAILLKAGYKVGLYTSPHLIDFRERVRVNGKNISEKNVCEITEVIRAKKAQLGIDYEITFFEYTTAIALYHFMLEKVDIALIEVGLGGRLDATNVVTPMVSVITSISVDHQQYLGETIGEIATEKAGIIKPTVPLVSGVRDESAKQVIHNISRGRDAKLYELGVDFSFSITGEERFDYASINADYKGLTKNLLGEHQYRNLSVALAVVELLSSEKIVVEENSIREGLANVNWAGRFELFSKSPLIILDGAHNKQSIKCAVDTLQKNFPEKKIISVIGVMSDKDMENIAKSIGRISHTVILTEPEIDRAAKTHKLAELFDESSVLVQRPVVGDALEYAKEICDDGSLIFVTGSLFTVGDARKILLGEHVNG